MASADHQNLPLPTAKALIASTTGIGQYTAGQLLKFAGITAEGGITNENAAALADAIGTLQKNINAAKAGTVPYAPLLPAPIPLKQFFRLSLCSLQAAKP